jgi:hypothetical protein
MPACERGASRASRRKSGTAAAPWRELRCVALDVVPAATPAVTGGHPSLAAAVQVGTIQSYPASISDVQNVLGVLFSTTSFMGGWGGMIGVGACIRAAHAGVLCRHASWVGGAGSRELQLAHHWCLLPPPPFTHPPKCTHTNRGHD